MKKKKIMWLCNARFSSEKIRATGSWLQPLAEHLQQTGMVDIVNITIGYVVQIAHEQLDGIEQYVIPYPHKKHHGQVPSEKFCSLLSEIEQVVNPDLVHVWGSEGIWVSAYAKGAIKTKW